MVPSMNNHRHRRFCSSQSDDDGRKKKKVFKKASSTTAKKKKLSKKDKKETKRLKKQKKQEEMLNNFQFQLPSRRSARRNVSSFSAAENVVVVPWLNDQSNNNEVQQNSNISSMECVSGMRRSNSYSSPPLPAFAPVEDNNNKKKKSKKIRLPTHDVPFYALQALNEEVQAFASYITLTPHEAQARQALIEKVEAIARGCFAQENRSRNNHTRFGQDNDDDSEDQSPSPQHAVHLQTFGSFATPAVCTFQSDIDLALWGVVDAPTAPLPRKRQTSPRYSSVTSRSQDDEDAASDGNPKKNESNNSSKKKTIENANKEEEQAKRSRVQRWADALAAMDFENELTANPVEEAGTQEDTGQEKAENEMDKETTLEASSSEQEEEDADDAAPLFVLDRAGANEQELRVDDAVDDKPAAAVTEVDETDTTNSHTTETTAAGSDDDHNHDDKLTSSTVANNAGSRAASDNEDHNNSDEDSADPLAMSKKSSSSTQVAPASAVWVAAASQMGPEYSELQEENEYQSDCSSKVGGTDSNSSDENDDMQVGFVVNHAAAASVASNSFPPARMSTYTRNKVVDALCRLKRGLCRAGMVETIQVIKNARVPIIKMKSSSLGGVELDIAIGGQTGADTRLYASQQTRRYQSFASVVLVLKVLLSQQELDMPYSGGLGSYKLYVLVAHHIQQHLQLGGKDECGEVLLSFLFRYGSRRVVGNHCVHPQARTPLSQDDVLETTPIDCSDDHDNVSMGSADLSNVFKLEECLHLFGCAWKRLWNRVRKSSNTQDGQPSNSNGTESSTSLLSEFIDPHPLDQQRERFISNATQGGATNGRRGREHLFPPRRQQPSTPQPAPRQGSNGNNKRRRSVSPSPNRKKRNKQQGPSSWPKEKTARQLVAGYSGSSSRSKKKQKR